MKIMPRTKRSILRIAGLAALAVAPLATVAKAEEVYSQIVGAIALNIPQESDVVVSFPFKKSTVFANSVTSATASGDNVVINFDGQLTVNQFAPSSSSHYVAVESGALKGRILKIVSNTADSITVEGAGLASSVVAADTFSVSEYWTLESAFPTGVASVDEDEPGMRHVELIVPNSSADAGSMNAEAIFFFSNGAWRKIGQPLTTEAGDYILEPNKAFVIRNNGEAPLKSYFFGEVSDAPLAIPLAVAENDDLDSFVSIGRPLDVKIKDLGLQGSGVFKETTSASDIQDRLLVYSLDSIGKNKKPAGEYYYYNNAWRKVGAQSDVDSGSDEVKANMALAVRKVKLGAAPSNSTQYWVNEWSLPQ